MVGVLYVVQLFQVVCWTIATWALVVLTICLSGRVFGMYTWTHGSLAFHVAFQLCTSLQCFHRTAAALKARGVLFHGLECASRGDIHVRARGWCRSATQMVSLTSTAAGGALKAVLPVQLWPGRCPRFSFLASARARVLAAMAFWTCFWTCRSPCCACR